MTVEALWGRLAEIQAKIGMRCGRAETCHAACCRPSVIGGSPGVTRPEIERINGFLATQRGFRFHEAGGACCKFLGRDGRCGIYAVRPIDCRVHFCRDDSLESQPSREVAALVAEYHSRHQAAFMETELIDSVGFLGEDTGSRDDVRGSRSAGLDVSR